MRVSTTKTASAAAATRNSASDSSACRASSLSSRAAASSRCADANSDRSCTADCPLASKFAAYSASTRARESLKFPSSAAASRMSAKCSMASSSARSVLSANSARHSFKLACCAFKSRSNCTVSAPVNTPSSAANAVVADSSASEKVTSWLRVVVSWACTACSNSAMSSLKRRRNREASAFAFARASLAATAAACAWLRASSRAAMAPSNSSRCRRLIQDIACWCSCVARASAASSCERCSTSSSFRWDVNRCRKSCSSTARRVSSST